MRRTNYVIPLLGLTQIISWGTLYYSLAVLAQPIGLATGWSNLVVYGAFSVSLLIAGFAAPSVGKWIDKTGGRHTMSLGSVLAIVALLTLASAPSPMFYLLGWSLAGLAMSLTLYEAAFSVTHLITPENYRRNITLLTLFGGFASTVFWPLTHFLNAQFGWRETLVIFALIHLLVTLPIHSLYLPNKSNTNQKPTLTNNQKPAVIPLDFKWLMLSFALVSAVFSVLSVFLIDAIQHNGFDRDQAVWLAALVGPVQVIGRLIELYYARHVPVYLVGLIALCGLLISLLLLNLLSKSWLIGLLFITLYGLANGVLTIVRGALPVELFGRENVGALLGKLALPSFVTKALMPGVFALLLMNGIDFSLGLWGLFITAAVALGFYLLIKKPSALVTI